MSDRGRPLVWLHGQIKTPPMSSAARVEAGWPEQEGTDEGNQAKDAGSRGMARRIGRRVPGALGRGVRARRAPPRTEPGAATAAREAPHLATHARGTDRVQPVAYCEDGSRGSRRVVRAAPAWPAGDRRHPARRRQRARSSEHDEAEARPAVGSTSPASRAPHRRRQHATRKPPAPRAPGRSASRCSAQRTAAPSTGISRTLATGVITRMPRVATQSSSVGI